LDGRNSEHESRLARDGEVAKAALDECKPGESFLQVLRAILEVNRLKEHLVDKTGVKCANIRAKECTFLGLGESIGESKSPAEGLGDEWGRDSPAGELLSSSRHHASAGHFLDGTNPTGRCQRR
jgi:hypothetical protein